MKLEIKPIPIPSGSTHPNNKSPVLPKHEFTMGLIAPKGSGKTTALMNLLKFYQGYFHNIIIFSPTVNNDEKWDWIKKQPLLVENKPLKMWIATQKNKEENPNSVVHKPQIGHVLDDFIQDFSPTIPKEHFLAEYDESTLSKIMHEQQNLIDLLKKFGKTKHLANRILFVFDDLVGSSLFSGKKKNPFKTLNTNHRHFSFSVLMVSQAYKEIPKTVRIQYSCLIIFEIPNENEVKAVYEENPLRLKFDDWVELYEEAVSGDHNFMYINYQEKDRKKRVMQNFNRYLFFSE